MNSSELENFLEVWRTVPPRIMALLALSYVGLVLFMLAEFCRPPCTKCFLWRYTTWLAHISLGCFVYAFTWCMCHILEHVHFN